MEKKGIVRGVSAGKEAKLWIEYLHQTLRETPARLEDAAKYISTMIGVSLTIFLAIVQKNGQIEITTSVKIALIAWILSLFLSFLVIFPFRYRCSSLSADSIESMHRRIIMLKWSMLAASACSFVVALGILAFKLF